MSRFKMGLKVIELLVHIFG